MRGHGLTSYCNDQLTSHTHQAIAVFCYGNTRARQVKILCLIVFFFFFLVVLSKCVLGVSQIYQPRSLFLTHHNQFVKVVSLLASSVTKILENGTRQHVGKTCDTKLFKYGLVRLYTHIYSMECTAELFSILDIVVLVVAHSSMNSERSLQQKQEQIAVAPSY